MSVDGDTFMSGGLLWYCIEGCMVLLNITCNLVYIYEVFIDNMLDVETNSLLFLTIKVSFKILEKKCLYFI